MWDVEYVTVRSQATVWVGYVPPIFILLFWTLADSSTLPDKLNTRRIPTPKVRRRAWPAVAAMVSEVSKVGFSLTRYV